MLLDYEVLAWVDIGFGAYWTADTVVIPGALDEMVLVNNSRSANASLYPKGGSIGCSKARTVPGLVTRSKEGY